MANPDWTADSSFIQVLSLLQFPKDFIPHCVRISLNRAFPDHKDAPAQLFERLGMIAVPLNRSGELCLPELRIRFWIGGVTTVSMAMPKAAMNEDCRSKRREDDIWFAWKALYVGAASVTLHPKQLSNGLFGNGVLAANLRHIKTALRWRVDVCHFTIM